MFDQSRRRRVFNRFKRLASPSIALAIVTSIAFFVYSIASTFDGSFTYFHRLVLQEQLIDNSTLYSYLWAFGAFLSFLAGGVIVNFAHKPNHRTPKHFPLEDSAFRTIFNGFLFTFITAFAWIGVAIIQFGGISSLANLAAADNIAARDVILTASFPGGRLISSGFIGIAVLSATLLGMGLWKSNTRKRFTIFLVLFVSLAYLGIAPILVSGRINFFVAVIGAFIGSSFAAGRVIGARYIPIGVLLLVGAWTAKQYFSLGHMAEDISVFDQSVEGFFFYLYNDALNLLNTIGQLDNNKTLGWYSLRFIFFFTFTQNKLLDFIADARIQIGNYVTAGEVPFLAAPIVDFGLWGVLILVLFGFCAQYVYLKAPLNLLYSTIYGMILACLILSPHASFITSQEVIYSILLVSFLARRMRYYQMPMQSKTSEIILPQQFYHPYRR
ncbi:O-antigen polymerase [Hydrogenophaga sp. ZJX-1]|uniref:O-antigen polymerase n=1 Tax=Hydrogenophaga sp. ZJX-1 TaxID=3404778 RepID=UPI003B27B55E